MMVMSIYFRITKYCTYTLPEEFGSYRVQCRVKFILLPTSRPVGASRESTLGLGRALERVTYTQPAVLLGWAGLGGEWSSDWSYSTRPQSRASRP